MRQSKEKGGQMGKSYPVLFDCKTQALKHCAPLHLETTLAHVGCSKVRPFHSEAATDRRPATGSSGTRGRDTVLIILRREHGYH